MNKYPTPLTPTAPAELVLNVATRTSYPYWLGELSRLGQEARVENGLYAGKPLNGYIRVPGIDAHQVDATKRKAIRRLFREAPCKSFRELLRIADEEGLKNTSGGRLGLSSLHNMLANPFYAGMVRSKGKLVPGRHKAIISILEFERYKESCKKKKC